MKVDPKKPATLAERWKQVKAAVANVPRAFALLWEADPSGAWAMAAITLVSAGLPAAHAWVTKLIIDGVVSALQRGDEPMAGCARWLPTC